MEEGFPRPRITYIGASGAAGNLVAAVLLNRGGVDATEDGNGDGDLAALAAGDGEIIEDAEEPVGALRVAAGNLVLAVVVAVALLLSLLDGEAGRPTLVGRALRVLLGEGDGGGGDGTEGKSESADGVHFDCKGLEGLRKSVMSVLVRWSGC